MKEPQLTARIQLVVAPETLTRIDNWRRDQETIPNLSEAVRRLLERGLEVEGK
jgi:hypothetical protein